MILATYAETREWMRVIQDELDLAFPPVSGMRVATLKIQFLCCQSPTLPMYPHMGLYMCAYMRKLDEYKIKHKE